MDEFNLQPLIDQINQVLQATLQSIGLGDSRLAKSVLIVRVGSSFEIRFNDYVHFIDSGRGANKTPPPIAPIKQWIERYGIKSTSNNITSEQLAYAISRSIGKKGIKAKPFLNRLSDEVAELVKIHIFEEQNKLLAKILEQ